MNNRQKLGYMALGAVVLAVGIAIGQFMTPDIEAQNNSVFDTVTCRKIIVVDEAGNERIRLNSTKDGCGVFLQDQTGVQDIALMATVFGNAVSVNNQAGELGVYLTVEESGNSMYVYDQEGNAGIDLSVSERGNSVMVTGKIGKEKVLVGGPRGGIGFLIMDREGHIKWAVP